MRSAGRKLESDFTPSYMTRLEPWLPPDALDLAPLPVPLEERDEHHPKATG
jgi:hypothetical protein